MHSSVRAAHSGRPRKSSSKTAWLKPTGQGQTVRFGSFWAAAGRPSGTVWGPPVSSRGPAQHQLLGPPGQRWTPGQPEPSARQSPSGGVDMPGPLGRQQQQHHPWNRGLQSRPWSTLGNLPFSRPFSEKSVRVRLRMSRCLGASYGLAGWSHPGTQPISPHSR